VRIFSRAYEEPRLRAALTAFYAEVGGLDYSVLLDAEYALARCAGCGLVFQVHVPDDALLARLYEEWISPGKAFARYHSDLPPLHYVGLASEVHLAATLIQPAAPRLALDYGCGWGEWARMTQAFGFEAWGTELSPTRRQHAARSGIRVVADAALPTAAFGLINLDQVLEHLPAPRETLSLLVDKLHPGGVIRIAVPNGLRVAHALRHFDRELTRPRLGGLNPVAPLEHLNCFTHRSLIHLARTCGLRRTLPLTRSLWSAWVFPPRWKGRLKQIFRPMLLRSNHTTQAYFTREEPMPDKGRDSLQPSR
jgi:SAM-dependent methyltransferase